jgi:hypothetical protein
MFDPLVLLTPLFVLVVTLLLGFAGCYAHVSGTGSYRLSVVVRVPTGLTVTLIHLDWTDPDGDIGQFDRENPQFSLDGVFSRFLQKSPSPGPWSVRCELTVRDGSGNTATDQAEYPIPTLEPGYENAHFQASGSPTNLDFDVAPAGLS